MYNVEVAAPVPNEASVMIQRRARIFGARAVRRRVTRHLLRARPADIMAPEIDARNQHGERGAIGGVWQRIQDRSIQHPLLLAALHVDDGRFPRHLDRFLEAADAHVGIDAGRKTPGQFDRVALHRRKAGQRELHRVHAGPQVLDRVLARAFDHRGPRFFKERRTRRFHGHARQHRAGRVFDDAADGRLRHRRDRKEQRECERRRDATLLDPEHCHPPVAEV